MQRLINWGSFRRLHVTVFVLVAILWFDGELAPLLTNHICNTLAGLRLVSLTCMTSSHAIAGLLGARTTPQTRYTYLPLAESDACSMYCRASLLIHLECQSKFGQSIFP